MKCLFTALVSLVYCALAIAQPPGVVRGRVVDRQTGEPLEFAIVRLAGVHAGLAGGPAVLTDAMGNFSVAGVAAGDSVAISFVGYRRVCVCALSCCREGGECGPAGCGQRMEFALDRLPADLRAITVTPCPNATSQTIGRLDLALRPVNSAQDLMRLVPGLFIGEHQGGGLAEHIFYRGFDADHGTDVNVSVDGMPVNLVSHIHGQGFSDLHFLIPELVTRIDYGKGPYYAGYGDFTTAGYVAFQTADAIDRSEVRIEGGQFHTGRVMARIDLLGNEASGHGESAYIAGEAAYTDGPFDLPQRLHRFNLFGKFGARLSAGSRLTVTVSGYEGAWRSSGEIPERTVKEGLTGRFGCIDSAQGGRTGRTAVALRLRTRLPSGVQLDNQAYFAGSYFTLHYDPTFFATDSLRGDQLRQQEKRNLAGYNGRLSMHRYFTGGGDLTTTLGAGAQANWIATSSLAHTVHGNQVIDELEAGVPREYTANAWADLNYRAGRWLLNAGGRVDWLAFSYQDALHQQLPARQKGVVSPKFNLSYNWNTRLQLYAKAGKGFHSNDVRAVIANRGLDVLPAAYGTDLGVIWKPLPGLLLNAAIWTIYLQQEFTYDGDEGTLEPGGRTIRKGVDLAARYQFTSWLFAHLDLNVCKARDLEAGKGDNYLPLAVPLCSTGSMAFKTRFGLDGSVSYRYMHDRPANADNTLVAQGYFVTDLLVNYHHGGWEIGLDVQNLLNTDWRETQFETESRLRGEPAPVDGISFTPGTPRMGRLRFGITF